MSIIIMGFRESFEAILLISIMIVFLQKNDLNKYIKTVYSGAFVGVIVAFAIALILNIMSNTMESQGEVVDKLWGIGSGLIASLLILVMVIAMIKNKKNIGKEIEYKVSKKINKTSLFLISSLMVAREGFEIILFIFANPNKSYIILEVSIGIILACALGYALNKSLIKINLKILFKYLLIFLILQVGYVFGDAIHEFIELLETLDFAPGNFILYTNVFDLSGTFIDSESSPLGILLAGTLGWYSDPQILQFIGQYSITGYLIYLYKKHS